MARPCTVCLHGRLSEINKALVLGTGLRQTSNRFAQWGRLSIYALHRHAHAHISDKAKAAIIAGAPSMPGMWSAVRVTFDPTAYMGFAASTIPAGTGPPSAGCWC